MRSAHNAGSLSLSLVSSVYKCVYKAEGSCVSSMCTCPQVFDARALRVIVDDEGGSRSHDAVETCYKLVSTVHSIWKPVPHVSSVWEVSYWCALP